MDPTPAPTASHALPASLRAFLEGLIDYAGLFPPARLPLEDALPGYVAYRHTDDAWMLSHFIAPASLLADMAVYTDLFRHEAPLPVSVLGTASDSAEAFARHLQDDLAAVRAFAEEHAGRVRPDQLELRLPAAVVEAGPAAVGALLDRAAGVLDAGHVAFERVFFEVAFAGDGRRGADGAIEALARAAQRMPCGFKVRCGGVTADAFPTVEQVAFVIAACRDAGVPFKATAGLHHPLRHVDRALEVMQHGFMNVFGAGVLAHAIDLTEAALRQVLRSESMRDFVFDETGFAFQDLRITTEQVRAARQAFARSFGSCSFDEPRDDLRAAALL